jgi:tRNA (guanine37-N1)-methyltransferase
MTCLSKLHVALLHEEMRDRSGKLTTTSLTLIDIHDISRSVATYSAGALYVCHPSQHLRQLARELQGHWREGYGSTYNPNRKEALEFLKVVSRLDDAIADVELRWGQRPKLIATSAQSGAGRITFQESSLLVAKEPCILMLGTGHGMSEQLLARADVFLEPIRGGGPYNHLSVRSALAIMLDKLASA